MFMKTTRWCHQNMCYIIMCWFNVSFENQMFHFLKNITYPLHFSLNIKLNWKLNFLKHYTPKRFSTGQMSRYLAIFELPRIRSCLFEKLSFFYKSKGKCQQVKESYSYEVLKLDVQWTSWISERSVNWTSIGLHGATRESILWFRIVFY